MIFQYCTVNGLDESITDVSCLDSDINLSIQETERIINEKEIDLICSISSIWRFTVPFKYKKIAF